MDENKNAIKALISVSQDALLAQNSVLAFKVLQQLEKVVDGEKVEEPKSSSVPTNPFAVRSAIDRSKGVYPELEERAAPAVKKVSPEIVVVEEKPNPENQKVLERVEEKANKMGMNLAVKEEPEEETSGETVPEGGRSKEELIKEVEEKGDKMNEKAEEKAGEDAGTESTE